MKIQPLYVARQNKSSEEHRKQLSESVNQALDIIGSVSKITLNTDTVRSTFSVSQVNNESFIGFTPLSAEAANEKSNIWIETVSPSTSTSIPSYTLRHTSTSTAVFTYNTVIIG